MNLTDLTKIYDFTGRSVVITGGTGILCSAMAQALVGCGANVAIIARNPEKGAAVAEQLKGSGRAIVAQADVLNKDELQAAMAQVTSEFGRIDCLINGAGGNSPNATTRPDQSFFDLPQEAFKYVFELNLIGTILPTQVFGKQMAEQGDGVILNEIGRAHV